ncbi:adenylyl-sulfate kinase [Pseudomonas leptonychotis]|uniref:adenylyl-sulfate kinase n=1 Tax=Pseudomonas leptonychotis TaxID=2448482 RepID=UPI0039F02B6F
MVIWLIGLSGSGKTTLGKEIVSQWKTSAPNTVLVDGDEVRRIFRQDTQAADYSMAGRRLNAERIFELCAWLDAQNINVVCSILSIFPDLRARNREQFQRYFEVYLNPPMQTLLERDTKGLYRKALAGEMNDMVGVDIAFPAPTAADLEIDTSQPGDVSALAHHIIEQAQESA